MPPATGHGSPPSALGFPSGRAAGADQRHRLRPRRQRAPPRQRHRRRVRAGKADLAQLGQLHPYSDAGPPSMVTHVETKYATMMRESGQTYGVIVLNNAVCNLKTGCGASARAILPRGSTLVIWEPGATSPVEIHGEARP
ncbi:DddA-like double-stranded DNA deaminase toxin [Saccharopolyspora sp. CA-218241]|uniref:DddA-like double-stranded DNA deaminase toxin n=1 Tax=Saccharopolyspora sp. CA-218241 TaxID=3240027 RepID=UPI003D97F41C